MASIRQRGNSIYATVRLKGIEESKPFPIKAYPSKKHAEAAANEWAAKKESEILAGKFGTVPDATFGNLLEKYRDQVSPTKRGARWEKIRINMYLNDPIAKIHLRDLNSTHIVEWRDRRLKEVSGSTICRDWNVLSSAINRARSEWKWGIENPMTGVKRPAESKAREKIHTEEELSRMTQCADYRKDIPLVTKTQRTFAAYLLSCETALRVGELAALDWPDIFLQQKFLKVTGVKPGAKKNEAAIRVVPLTPRAIEILEQLALTKNSDTEPVFGLAASHIDVLFRKVRDAAGIEDLHYHDSRHAAITMLSKHYEVLQLAKIVGHKKIQQLMTYYNPTINDLVKRLHGGKAA